ncbi:MAG: hypothetical protein AAGK04_11980 [Planctomycetota bacterium]
MTTTCPNCSSTAALGGEVTSICTECASVSVAGTSFSMPMLLAGVAGVVAVAWVVRLAVRRWPRFTRVAIA